MRLKVCVIFTCMAIIMGACQNIPDMLRGEEELFLPPTPKEIVKVTPSPEPSATPTQIPIIVEFQPTPTPQCTDSLLFVEDLTVPDGSQVQSGMLVDKRWQVENNGTCNWNNEYRLRWIAGAELGVRAEQALYPARSGTQMMIRVLFEAPQEAGSYRSAWQAYSPTGEPFGDPIFIEIVVVPQG